MGKRFGPPSRPSSTRNWRRRRVRHDRDQPARFVLVIGTARAPERSRPGLAQPLHCRGRGWSARRVAQTGDSAATCAAPSGSPGARWGVTFAAPKQRRALAPLLRDARLSKDAMSRLVALLRENFVTTTPRAQWPKIAIQRCTNHTVEPARQGPGPSARGTRGELSAGDLRREPRDGGSMRSSGFCASGSSAARRSAPASRRPAPNFSA